MPARISLVTLGVSDLARASAFYEALGWPKSSSSVDGEVAFFRMTGAVLGLWSYEKLAADARLVPGERPGFAGIALAINLESEPDVDRVLAEAAAAGATLLKPAERADWGGYSGYFADPDGYAWEVAYNPGWPFAADGSIDLPE